MPAARTETLAIRPTERTEWQRRLLILPDCLAEVEMPPLLRDLIFIDLATDVEGGLRKIIEFFRSKRSFE